MTSTPLRQVARLAGPAIAQQLLHTLVFLVDRGLLGHHDAASLASMQISGPVVWSATTILGAFTVGVVAVVGRRVGAADPVGAGGALRASLLFALAVGAVALGLGLLSREPLLALFPEAGPAVWAEADGYLTVAFAAMPALLLSLTLAMALQAAGDTRTPFLVAAVGNLLNVALSYVLIYGVFGEPMGAQGAALGSAVAFGWQALALGLITASRKAPVSWRAAEAFDGGALRRVLRVAGPSLAERILQQIGFMAYVTMIGALGALAMGANQALIGVEAIVFLSADGIGIATAAVVAQRLGRDEPSDARAALRGGLLLSTALLGAVGVLFLLVPTPLLRPFTNEGSLLTLAVPCLAVAGVAAPIMGAAVVASAALRGAGDTRAVLAVTFFGGVVVRLGATYLAAFHFELGLLGAWIGSTADWVVRAVLLLLIARGPRWLTHRL